MDPKDIALAYIDACARKDYDAVSSLLAADIRVVGPNQSINEAAPYLTVLRRLGAVWVRSDVKKVFSDGSEVCMIYDFVTNTPAGAVPIVEWLGIAQGRVAAVTLVYDRVAFKPASDELARRAAAG